MSGRRVLATFALLVLVTGSLDSVYAQAPPVYKVEDLGSLGGQYLIALAMNNNGDVAGANIAYPAAATKIASRLAFSLIMCDPHPTLVTVKESS